MIISFLNFEKSKQETTWGSIRTFLNIDGIPLTFDKEIFYEKFPFHRNVFSIFKGTIS
jgi:hypothetical protein